ncbi:MULTISPECIES: phosphate/phosphite/phosphonate ABC transporter substrate-binding protein [unclassified Pseudomonas]|uniref:phosphate/phosphite/phosphonate ABC transporter substrate-binding protein n=1 Tax=unclassified Pseudomonas TaxID=196821 RepID=UPI00244C9575|nr:MULTISPECIES: phosphate/phosphite/phosphonate ABC transporter substrate-binding protein [unclassified Pseudomonas]MDH0301606.1 phosphate/phosphite/phosphonate ABC transporter substrate-binding protein [Pseudomonas sp. GD04091]MDH1987284.1 phosphate/phosphite/phosphonate ABC transporter substrate-binding protein [Pseudomonas sp. GD03689]
MGLLRSIALLALAPLLASQAQAGCTPHSLRLAVIPIENVEAMTREHQPLLERLGKAAGVPVELVVSASYESVVDAIVSGGADIARLGPASYLLAHRRDRRIEAFATFTLSAGTYTPAGNHYQALLLTRADGPASLEAVRGARVALSDPASTSGSLVPSVEFAAQVGTPLPRYFRALVYAGNHDKALAALLEGRVDAAFVASERADAYLASHGIDPARLQVLWRSAPIHYDPYVFSASLCPALKQRLRKAMLADPQGLAAFVASQHATGLVPVAHKDYAGLEQLMDAR